MHVLRVPIRWKTWWTCSRAGVLLARAYIDTSGELSVLTCWVDQRILQCIVQGIKTYRRGYGKS